MKTSTLLFAISGAFCLASAQANATVNSSSFRVSITIAAPCNVSNASGSVAVDCEGKLTPYHLHTGLAVQSGRTPRQPELVQFTAAVGESVGYRIATVTF